jgi:PIN domain nuclease of toxin-antitoxin system
VEHLITSIIRKGKEMENQVEEEQRIKNGDKTGVKTRRYNLTLPEAVYQDVEKLAQEEGVQMTDILRTFIKMGIIAHIVHKDPDKQLIIREGEEETEILMVY